MKNASEKPTSENVFFSGNVQNRPKRIIKCRNHSRPKILSEWIKQKPGAYPGLMRR